MSKNVYAPGLDSRSHYWGFQKPACTSGYAVGMTKIFDSIVVWFVVAAFVMPSSGGGRRGGFNGGFRNNNRHYGNFRGRPHQNPTQVYQNERFPFNNDNSNANNGATCPRPLFTDGSLEIENCANNRHFACHDTNQEIPVSWKAKMICQKGNRILKYTSWCLENGSWSPPFLDNCDQVFDLQNANSNSDSTHQEQSHGHEASKIGQNNNQITRFNVAQECKMLQIHLSNNFVLTCLKPGYFVESPEQCVEANEPVVSGTKVFLRCKSPFTNPTNEDSEWTCNNGNWDGASRKMVCVYEYSTKPASPTSNYGWTAPTVEPEPPVRYVPPAPVTKATTTTTPAPRITQPPLDMNANLKLMCPPLTLRSRGIQIQCIMGGSQVYGTSCEKWTVVGTEASYSCRQYYESNFSLKALYRTCKEDGTWTGSSDSFTCVAQCGKSNTILSPRITFGAATTRSQWPWHAAIFLKDKHGEWKLVCGGTVLTSKSVITAAHCITLYQTRVTRDPTEVRVELGKFRREERDEYVQIMQVEAFEVYDSYDPFSFESDIGIILLKDEITFGYHVRPVCFPQTPDSALEEQQLGAGSIGTVIGFGYDEFGNLSDELKMASLRVVSQTECSEVNEGGSLTSINSRSTTYCAGLRNKTNVCNGDSGGGMVFPLKSEDTIRWYLQGIVSAGISDGGKCDPEKYSVFTRVGRYASWITRTLSHHDVF